MTSVAQRHTAARRRLNKPMLHLADLGRPSSTFGIQILNSSLEAQVASPLGIKSDPTCKTASE